MRWEEEIAAREHWAAVAAHAEGRAEGKAEGIVEGRAKGKAEGIVEGKAEGKAEGKFEMVKNFLNVGTPIEFIVKATGWSEDQILKVAQSN